MTQLFSSLRTMEICSARKLGHLNKNLGRRVFAFREFFAILRVCRPRRGTIRYSHMSISHPRCSLPAVSLFLPPCKDRISPKICSMVGIRPFLPPRCYRFLVQLEMKKVVDGEVFARGDICTPER